MWKNLHRHKKMMPFSVRLTLRWVLEPRFSSIGPRLGSMVRRWRVLCIILWLSMRTICFAAFFSLSRRCGKISGNLSKPPWKSPKIISNRLQFPQNPPSDARQKPPRSPPKWFKNYVKLSREPPEMIPITPSFLPCPDPIKPAHDPLEALKTEDKNAPQPHAQARII